MSKAILITKEQMHKYVVDWSDKKPIPKDAFYAEYSEGVFVGMDNRTNDCWMEDFSSKEACIEWCEQE